MYGKVFKVKKLLSNDLMAIKIINFESKFLKNYEILIKLNFYI